jgi:zinc transport system ATP-binding protein
LTNLLEVKDLTVVYKRAFKNFEAVNNVSFNVNRKDYLCVIGNNGSGKSSLMKAILGFVPISSGFVNFNIKKRDISYMPQTNGINSDFPADVREIVLSGTQKSRKRFFFYNKQDLKNAEKIFISLGLIDLKKRSFFQLSVGQQQRVLLARALINKPRIIFLDEPCSGLDESTCNQFYDILENLCKQEAASIVMISHDSSQIQRYATHVLYLNKKTLFYGSVNDWILKKQNVKCIH